MWQRTSQMLMVLSCLVLLGCTAVASQPEPIQGVQHVPPGFESVLKNLQKQTQVPVVLPTRIPTQALVEMGGKPQPYLGVELTEEGEFKGVYPFVLTTTPAAYEVSLDAESDCQGAGACSFGLLSGQKLMSNTPTVAQEYAYQSEDPTYNPIARSPEKPGPVSLSKGIKGYFVPYVCGANCDTSKVFWEQNGYRYMVGIRYASQKTMIEMANSAIANQVLE